MSLKDVLANRMSKNSTEKSTQKINPLLAHRLKVVQNKNNDQNSEVKNTEQKNETPVKITQDLVDKVISKVIAVPNIEKEEEKNSIAEPQQDGIEDFKLQTESAITEATQENEENSDKNTPVSEEKKEETAETIAEEEKQPEEKSQEIAEEILEEQQEEIQQSKTRSPKKKSSSNKSKKEDSLKVQTTEFSKINVLGQKFDYDEAAAIVMNEFIDDKWKEYEKEIIEKLDNIRIEPDMNPGTLKYALADLNNLYDEIAVSLIEQKKILDALTDKDFGVANAYKAANKNIGNNEAEREANAIAALTSVGENKINFIALIAAAKMRYVFLNSIYQRIQYKSNICITMSGAIKMEMNLSNGVQ